MQNIKNLVCKLFPDVQKLRSGKSKLYEMYWISGKIDIFEFKLLIQDNSENASSIIVRGKINNELDSLKKDIVIEKISNLLNLVGKETIIDEITSALKNDEIEMSQNIVVEINIGDDVNSDIMIQL